MFNYGVKPRMSVLSPIIDPTRLSVIQRSFYKIIAMYPGRIPNALVMPLDRFHKAHPSVTCVKFDSDKPNSFSISFAVCEDQGMAILLDLFNFLGLSLQVKKLKFKVDHFSIENDHYHYINAQDQMVRSQKEIPLLKIIFRDNIPQLTGLDIKRTDEGYDQVLAHVAQVIDDSAKKVL